MALRYKKARAKCFTAWCTLYYPFTPEEVTPSTKYFCAEKKRINAGTRAKKDMARI